jgi:phosphate-selective porin OprO/OprP
LNPARFGHWDAELDNDFADHEVDVKDAYIQYQWTHTYHRSGQFKEPFSLERFTSSRYILFMERALPTLPDALPTGIGLRKIGVVLSDYGNRWHVTGGFFGQDVGGNTGDDESYAFHHKGHRHWTWPGLGVYQHSDA